MIQILIKFPPWKTHESNFLKKLEFHSLYVHVYHAQCHYYCTLCMRARWLFPPRRITAIPETKHDRKLEVLTRGVDNDYRIGSDKNECYECKARPFKGGSAQSA